MYMSLTNDDLQAIREIIKNEVSTIISSTVKEELRPISGELQALRNDIKEHGYALHTTRIP